MTSAPKFIGYHLIDGEQVQVSTGRSHAEAQSKAITRVLRLGVSVGEIAITERPDVSDADFDTLAEVLDGWFTGKGETQ
jgi:hypothetical protein